MGTVPHHPNSCRGVSVGPWCFGPEHYRFLQVLIVFPSIVLGAFILHAVVNPMWKEDAVRIRPHSKTPPWPRAKCESLLFLSSAPTSICSLFLFSFFWPRTARKSKRSPTRVKKELNGNLVQSLRARAGHACEKPAPASAQRQLGVSVPSSRSGPPCAVPSAACA